MPPLLPPASRATDPADTRKARDAATRAQAVPFTALVLPQVPDDVASASDLLTRAQGIVQRELQRLDAKSFDRGLDPREVASVVTLIKAITEIQAEERLLAQRSKLDGLSDAELQQAVNAAIAKRAGTPTETPP